MKARQCKFFGRLAIFILIASIICSFAPGLVAIGSGENQVKVEVWHRWFGQRGEVFDEAVANFHAKNPKIKVKVLAVGGEYLTLEAKILAKYAAGGEPPDIVLPGYYLLLHSIETFSPVKIDEVAGAEAEVVYDKYLPATLKLGQINGEQWALPFALSNAVMYYNPNIFEKAGLDPTNPPKTWKELTLTAKTIKDRTEKFPFFMSAKDTWCWAALIGSSGASLEENGRAAFNSSEAVEAMKIWTKFYGEGLTPKITTGEAYEALQMEKIAMLITSVCNLGQFAEGLPSIRTAQFPAFDSKPKRLPSGGAALMILSQNVQKQKASWELIKYLVSKEGLTTWIQTGYISPLDPKKVEVPLLDSRQKVAYEQLPYAVKWINWPGAHGLEVERILRNWRDKILYGEIDVEEGLDKAVEAVNALLL